MAFNDEIELVRRIFAGEAGAVTEFISTYRQFIFTILIRYLNFSPDDAEEVFQRFVFHLWEDDFRRLREWRRKTNLAAYLAKIARNLAHDYRREIRFETDDQPEVPLDDPRLTNMWKGKISLNALYRV